MINTLLSAISGSFSKDFLFASALPALLLLVWIAGVAVGIFGFDYSFALVDQLSASQKASAVTFVSISIIVTAYLLSALRSSLIRVWSGESKVVRVLLAGFVHLMESRHRSRYKALEDLKEKSSFWLEIKPTFEKSIDQYRKQNSRIPDLLVVLLVRIKVYFGLYPGVERDKAIKALEGIAKCYALCSEKTIRTFHRGITRRLRELHEIESYTYHGAHATLDREFGAVANIRATRLGNVIQAYNNYGLDRYKLETEIFWPRLLRVIPDEYMASVREPKIILDFAVTMATISILLAFCVAMFGPWLWYDKALSIGLVFIHLAAAAFFYFLGVNSAIQYGDMIRSCVDLFRLDLMAALQFTRPRGLIEERSRWEKVSQHLAYGQSNDLKIPPASGEAG